METKKQYLLLVDDVGMALLSQIIPSINFIQVEGMDIKEDPLRKVLVHPVPPVEAPKVEHSS